MSDTQPQKEENNYNPMLSYFRSRMLHQRASGKIYQRYKINTFELDLLCQLCAFCSAYGHMIVSKLVFFKTLTGNTRRLIKYEGYLLGLRNRGMVGSYEYVGRNNSLCIGISQLGWKALNDYWKACDELKERYPVKVPNLDSLVIPYQGYETRLQKLKPAA